MPPFRPDSHALRLIAAARLDSREELPELAIHPDDPMFRFLLEHSADRSWALVDYYRSGRSVLRAVRRVLDWRFGGRREGLRLLDFAAGFGRVTRHLAAELGGQQVWASDLLPGALRFHAEAFGVHTFPSTPDPAQLRCDTQFDLVLVSSLFSHLPEQTFGPWLRRLWQLLRPGGVLMFSVHDRSLLGGERNDERFVFRPSSEIPELPAEHYGTTWVDESYVREAIATVSDGRARACRFPRALWSFQDLWVAADGGETSSLALPGEPLGYLERVERSADGSHLSLSGWAADPSAGAGATVRVALAGELQAEVPTRHPRPEVGPLMGLTGVPAELGWSCDLVSDGVPFSGDAVLTVSARGRSGDDFLIHCGTLETSELGTRLRAARWENEQSGARIAAADAARAAAEAALAAARVAEQQLASRLGWMEASRFWKLRELWWSLRSRGGASGALLLALLLWSGLSLGAQAGSAAASWWREDNFRQPGMWRLPGRHVARLRHCLAGIDRLPGPPRSAAVRVGEGDFFRWRWAAYLAPHLDLQPVRPRGKPPVDLLIAFGAQPPADAEPLHTGFRCGVYRVR